MNCTNWLIHHSGNDEERSAKTWIQYICTVYRDFSCLFLKNKNVQKIGLFLNAGSNLILAHTNAKGFYYNEYKIDLPKA